MTTVAWDGTTLACDSQYTGSHIETVQLQKIKKLSSGAYFAFAGNPGEAEQVRKESATDEPDATLLVDARRREHLAERPPRTSGASRPWFRQ